MNVYDTLKDLHISLPPVAAPAAAYVPFVQTGNLVFISGHIAKKDGKPWVGQLGAGMQTAEGQQAAHRHRKTAAHLVGPRVVVPAKDMIRRHLVFLILSIQRRSEWQVCKLT
jgi:enamine deaminase RidA (YjgF/YER057c/UK114 family)